MEENDYLDNSIYTAFSGCSRCCKDKNWSAACTAGGSTGDYSTISRFDGS
ncbi:hypothetical protein JDF658_09270 [Carboxydocella sp. JDF658]|nr:hypothetical protein JDF658_09270 [Carboxydocella sp. JDF658]